MAELAPFVLTYDLVGSGWARITVRCGERVAPMVVSYLSDALRDLLDAVRAVAEGADQTQAVLADEPGEWVWTFRRDGALVAVDIRFLDGSHSTGRHDLSATTSVRDLARQLSREGRRLLQDFGEAGYRERWVAHEFPADSLRRLEGALEGREDSEQPASFRVPVRRRGTTRRSCPALLRRLR